MKAIWHQIRYFLMLIFGRVTPVGTAAPEPAPEPAPEELDARERLAQMGAKIPQRLFRPPVWVDGHRKPKRSRERLSPRPKRERAPPQPRPQIDEAALKASIKAAAEKEALGQFFFRDTILDQLSRYFVYIKRMKATDRDSYELYSRVGAHIVPLIMTHFRALRTAQQEQRFRALGGGTFADATIAMEEYQELSPWWKKHLPGFGAVVSAADSYGEETEIEDTEKVRAERGKDWASWTPKLLYFHKFKTSWPGIQTVPQDWTVYKMTIVWDKPYDAKHRAERKGATTQDSCFGISPDGEVHTLKTMTHTARRIYCKRGAWRGVFYLPETCWHYGEHYERWAADAGLNAKAFLKLLFIELAHYFERANSGMTRICAKKDGLAAVFAVDIERMPYFFQDRDVTINDKGIARPVFHIVRAHERQVGPDKKVPVRLHFRGERVFTWAGHDVEITVPGLHHNPLQEFGVAAIDESQKIHGEKLIRMKALAQLVDAEIIHSERPPRVPHAVTGQVLPARRAADEARLEDQPDGEGRP